VRRSRAWTKHATLVALGVYSHAPSLPDSTRTCRRVDVPCHTVYILALEHRTAVAVVAIAGRVVPVRQRGRTRKVRVQPGVISFPARGKLRRARFRFVRRTPQRESHRKAERHVPRHHGHREYEQQKPSATPARTKAPRWARLGACLVPFAPKSASFGASMSCLRKARKLHWTESIRRNQVAVRRRRR
jgi:hypothetical protein